MNESAVEPVTTMLASRGSAAELKLKLISLRQDVPDAPIFVFEGDDDRSVYFSWVRYLDASFSYEPFTCKGKGPVLMLKQVVSRDVSGLASGVYFFVDRDFDGSRDVTIDETLYVTDGYSIENHLVCQEVLREVLKIEFHCHAAPVVREQVVALFAQIYAEFLEASADVNRELHAARHFRIELQEKLPKSVCSFVEIHLDKVMRLAIPSSSIVKTARPISDEERNMLSEEFESLNPAQFFRGKFALSFFMQWLERLARERKEQVTQIFEGLDADVRVANGRLSVATLASRSTPPPGFRAFFGAIQDAA